MLRRLYYWWMEKVLDRHVCKEFTQWKEEVREYTRPVNYTDGNLYTAGIKTLKYSRRFQSRRCTICGKVQQSRLEL